MSIGNRIKSARQAAGLNQEQLAKAIGVSKGAIGNYEADISRPKEEILIALMYELNVDANYIYQDYISTQPNGDDASSFSFQELEHIKKYRTLDEYGTKAVDSILDIEFERCHPTVKMITRPYYSTPVSAGLGNPLDEPPVDEMDIEDTPEHRKGDFIVKVSGDSMEPQFHDGNYVLVQKMPQIEIGETGIFILNGQSYIKNLGNDELISLNSKYQPIQFSEFDNIICCGKVIGKV